MQIRTFVLIFLSMAGLFVVDKFLARMEQSETRAEAARLFEEGRRFAAKGQNKQAIERFRAAVADSRDNREYRLALASALLKSGKTADAETVLSDILAEEGTDGPANLEMARVLVQEQDYTKATSYYHRAIYGRWSAGHDILPVRLELIDLLDRLGNKRDLLAELLPIQDQATSNPELQLRLAQLYLRAGSPMRGAEVFRKIVSDRPDSVEARAGLGEALFQAGSYAAARTQFHAAMRLNPDDNNIRKRVALCDEILALDPSLRGLNSAERRRRSRSLLQRVIEDTSECMPSGDAGKAVSRNSESEVYLSQAETLWNSRGATCPNDEAVSLVLAKLSH
jgi:Flp pilus assembly protein TadD